MSSELPADPSERGIFLRALREYSESCTPPQLTADCPFSIDTEPGVRACGEECMDLLGQYDAPRPSEEVDLGGGFTFRRTRRPRPRHLSNLTGKAFDAREIYLVDKANSDVSRWRLASLLHGLVDEVQKPPSAEPDLAADRRQRIDKLIQTIEGRGLHFATHVLPQIRHAASAAVFSHLVLWSRDRSGGLGFDTTGGWSSLVNDHLESPDSTPSSETLGKAFEELLSPIRTWARAATVDDLLDWVAPRTGPIVTPHTEAVAEPDEDGQWIVDRFTKTYLEEWTHSSLRKEWLYVHGQHEPPCMTLEMSVRRVPESDLAMVMADRFVAGDRPRPQLSRSLVEPAVHFLRDGRLIEAVALFEAAIRLEPGSPDALNNLGFCLLPDRPDRALECFESANATGSGDTELINVNRILALASAGRVTSAIDLAETHHRRYSDGGLRPTTWLWDIDSILSNGDPTLIECRDLLNYVEQLRSMIDTQVRPTAERARMNET